MDIAASPPLVRAQNLRLTVPAASGPVNILNGVDLDLRRGESVGVVGPSGSGKTSLLMVLAGLERATGGFVELAGHDLTVWARTRWRACGATRSASCSRAFT